MRLLLDTHTLLWFGLDDRRLSATARGLIEDPTPHAPFWPMSSRICR
jgi:PIN domain nuclease of toxin-antitoxin system